MIILKPSLQSTLKCQCQPKYIYSSSSILQLRAAPWWHYQNLFPYTGSKHLSHQLQCFWFVIFANEVMGRDHLQFTYLLAKSSVTCSHLKLRQAIRNLLSYLASRYVVICCCSITRCATFYSRDISWLHACTNLSIPVMLLYPLVCPLDLF